MIRIALATLLLTSPTFAQDVARDSGTCTDGALWWKSGTAAGFGPCEAPEDGFFVLSCTDGTTTLAVKSPYPIAEAQRGTVDLTVDGRLWRLEGRGVMQEATGTIGLDGITVPEDALTALARGSAASLDMPTEYRPFHLTGSGAAITALTDGC
ncbi:MAG: hypothetical protein WBA67_16075 [Jannaschia sp.]